MFRRGPAHRQYVAALFGYTDPVRPAVGDLARIAEPGDYDRERGLHVGMVGRVVQVEDGVADVDFDRRNTVSHRDHFAVSLTRLERT